MWCDEEANTKEDAITSSKRTIGDLMATIEELTQKISSEEADLTSATEIRDKEKADFAASE